MFRCSKCGGTMHQVHREPTIWRCNVCWYYHGPVPTIPETGKEKWAIKVRPLFGTHPTSAPYVAGVNSGGIAFHTSDLNSARKFCNLHDAVDFILNAENVYSRWPDYTIIRARHISKWEEVID